MQRRLVAVGAAAASGAAPSRGNPAERPLIDRRGLAAVVVPPDGNLEVPELNRLLFARRLRTITEARSLFLTSFRVDVMYILLTARLR